MQAPLIPIVLSFILGITAGYFIQIPDTVLHIACITALAALAVASFRKWKRLSVAMILLVLFLSGIMNLNLFLYSNPSPVHISNIRSDERIGLEGTVCDAPRIYPDRAELTVESSGIVKKGIRLPVEGKVLIAVRDTEGLPRCGDLVRIKTRLKEPRNFQNPGGFDYIRFLRLRGILVRGSIDSASEIALIRRGPGSSPWFLIDRFRSRLRELIRGHAPSPEYSILLAMVLGEQNEIPKDIRDKFNRTGTSHILAISGFNIGIIYLFFILIIGRALRSSEYLLLKFNITEISIILTAIPVIAYTYIAGLGVSLIRAALMVMVLAAAAIYGRRRDLPNTLAFAALAILVVSPPYLFDVSFQLSFAAVASILLIVPRFSALDSDDPGYKIEKKPRFLKWALRNTGLFILVTLAAVAGTAPLIVYYFNIFSLVVVLANIVLVPVLGYAVTLLSMAIIMAAPLSSSISIFLIRTASYLIRLSISIVDGLSSLRYATINVPTPTWMEMAAYYLLLVSVIKWIDLHRKKDEPSELKSKKVCCIFLAATAAFFFVLDGLYYHYKGLNPGRLELTFLDVGQGNAALLRFPGGKTMLVDGGGSYDSSFDTGRYVVSPFLRKQKTGKIDIVVLTHPHPDHLNGLLYILKNFDVQEMWTNGQEIDTETYAEMKKIISEKKIVLRIMNAKCPEMDFNNTTVRILNPQSKRKANDYSDRTVNDEALVLKITYGKIKFLLPADISESVEERLVRSGMDLASQVILASHHGSRSSNSPSFIRRVRPDMVVFSCGKNNAFRMPHPDVLERYRKSGSRILRTDTDGAVHLTSDGESLKIDTYAEQGNF